MQQTRNGGNHTLLDFVRQGVAIKRKMGKKCFCRTMKFAPQNFASKNTLPSRDFSSKVAYKNRIKTTTKNKQSSK